MLGSLRWRVVLTCMSLLSVLWKEAKVLTGRRRARGGLKHNNRRQGGGNRILEKPKRSAPAGYGLWQPQPLEKGRWKHPCASQNTPQLSWDTDLFYFQ